ncbi:MAG: RNase P modulator RnpM [Oscillospiraceae bacterium]
MQTKKIPMRMCIGCHEMKPKRELVRIVRSKDGEISLDRTGKLAGRGAYICIGAKCLAKAQKSKALQKAFGAEIPDEIYDRLRAEASDE